jgi:hypothetical protein
MEQASIARSFHGDFAAARARRQLPKVEGKQSKSPSLPNKNIKRTGYPCHDPESSDDAPVYAHVGNPPQSYGDIA